MSDPNIIDPGVSAPAYPPPSRWTRAWRKFWWAPLDRPRGLEHLSEAELEVWCHLPPWKKYRWRPNWKMTLAFGAMSLPPLLYKLLHHQP
jgi:hypothetical protein